MTVKTRFCPSPSGYMHLGNARTALFNALLAKQQQGVFLLRIEDTDLARSTQDYIDAMQVDLKWLGLHWQEGMEIGGEHAPYQQSARMAVYEKYYQQLEAQGLAYPCFCSEQQLTVSRKLQRAIGKAPRYIGTCRGLSADEVAAKRQQGLQATLRFAMPRAKAIVFNDAVKGEQRFQSDDIGDFIIRRADGTASFMFCNAIDDAVMGVTHALRGEDHLTNTPRQVVLLEALGLPAPQYAHISLIVAKDNSPLSKRNGSRSIRELCTEGYLPLAVINYLARLGHYYQETMLLSYAELASAFSLTKLGSAAAKFDSQQLLYWQKQAVLQLTDADFWQWLDNTVHVQVPVEQQSAFIHVVRPNVVFPAEAKVWAEVLFADELVLDEQARAVLQATPAAFVSVMQQALAQHGVDYAALTQALKDNLQVKGKALFQPLRVVLTGQLHGPELEPILQLLGQPRALQRAHAALPYCQGV